MGILVQNLIKRGCITIKENANIYELIEILNKNSIGCVVVISEKKKSCRNNLWKRFNKKP